MLFVMFFLYPSSFLSCLQIETEREIKPLTVLVIEMFPRAQVMEWPGLGKEKRGDKVSGQ